ncbi:hypothetical protein NDU88_007665 [Pleurodeles waltl]|uniref:Uncharacterized protein n=1 Tax=Pleurodeles waltl TaxID=8319 RepID=A0AAV7QPP0_PLEWA|nr:hypothetical protein NDU88_007665 [Pleurodeles waltl]
MWGLANPRRPLCSGYIGSDYSGSGSCVCSICNVRSVFSAMARWRLLLLLSQSFMVSDVQMLVGRVYDVCGAVLHQLEN